MLPVGCRVDRKINQSIHLDTSIPDGIIGNLPEATDTLKLDMTIKVFKDSDYQVQLATPVRLPVGTPIFIELSVDKSKLQGGDKKAKIIVTKCVTYPYNDSIPDLHHTVINDRVVQDKSAMIFKSPYLNNVRFKMQTMKIGINFREVYLSCAAFVCPSGDGSNTCTAPRAMAQHTAAATRHHVKTVNKSSSQTIKSPMQVTSENLGIELPEFRPGQLTSADVPELDDEDYIRISNDDKQLAYHFKSFQGDYIVGLYKGTGKI